MTVHSTTNVYDLNPDEIRVTPYKDFATIDLGTPFVGASFALFVRDLDAAADIATAILAAVSRARTIPVREPVKVSAP